MVHLGGWWERQGKGTVRAPELADSSPAPGSPAAEGPLANNGPFGSAGTQGARALKEWPSPAHPSQYAPLPPGEPHVPQGDLAACQDPGWTGALLLQGAGAGTGAGCSGGLNGLHGEVGHLGPHAARQWGALGDVIRLVDVQAVRRLKHGRPLHQVQGDLHAHRALSATSPFKPCLAMYKNDSSKLAAATIATIRGR